MNKAEDLYQVDPIQKERKREREKERKRERERERERVKFMAIVGTSRINLML